jgi:bzd-type benzoyl-CoA reductase N subunit
MPKWANITEVKMKQEGQGWLEGAKKLSQNRGSRVRELKNDGKKIVGYFCSYFPLEILTAADLVPYRIMGNLTDTVTDAHAYCDPALCPFVKSCFDAVLKGEYDFLDGWVTPDSCDSRLNLYRIWNYNLPLPYSYRINVPNFLDEACFKFFKEELVLFKKSIEKFTQSEISDQRLQQAIKLHNEQRALLRELYQMRKPEPPLVYGSEVIQIMIAVASLPIEEANQLIKGVISEVKERSDGLEGKKRLLVWGPEIDHPAFFKLIEDSGGNVVIDDLCLGTRYFWYDVDNRPNPLDGLSVRYLDRVMCPRTIRGRGEGWATYQQDLEERFGHIREFAKEFSVDGVILYVMKYCDLHELDVPDLRDYLEKEGLPVLHIESDYTMAAVGALKTRIQAFLEMID